MKLPSSHATTALALVALSLSSSVVDVDAADIPLATAGHERNLGSGDFDFDSFEGLWQATGLWRDPATVGEGIDTDDALAVFKCTKTTKFPGDYCEVTMKLNSIWGCLPILGLRNGSPPCALSNPNFPDDYPFFVELVGKITKGQFDSETGSVVANLYQRNGWIGENCESSVSTSATADSFQLKLNAGGGKGYAKSFSIEVINSNTGEVYPPSSNCGSQNYYKIGGGFK